MVAIQKTLPRIAPHLEKSIEQRIRIRLAREPDLLLWRHAASGLANDAQGNFFRGGLPPGAPDLIGILAPTGRWFALETKSATGRATPRQLAFHALIRRFNGFVALVRSEDDAIAALERARMGLVS